MTGTWRMISILAALSIGGAAASAQETVRVGYAPFNTPLSSLTGATSADYRTFDPDGNKAEGALIDLARAIAAEAGFRVKFVPIAGAEAVAALRDGKFDLGTNSQITKEIADVTRPFYANSDGLVVAKADTGSYREWNDLKGEIVTTQPNSPLADALVRSGIFREVRLAADGQAGARAVAEGTAKAYFTTSLAGALANVNRRIPPFDMLRVPTGYQPRFRLEVGFSTRRGDALLARVDASLAKLENDDSLRRIFEKHGLGELLLR